MGDQTFDLQLRKLRKMGWVKSFYLLNSHFERLLLRPSGLFVGAAVYESVFTTLLQLTRTHSGPLQSRLSTK
jgi:hypothetical protein